MDVRNEMISFMGYERYFTISYIRVTIYFEKVLIFISGILRTDMNLLAKHVWKAILVTCDFIQKSSCMLSIPGHTQCAA